MGLSRSNYPKSELIKDLAYHSERRRLCYGDMWPYTWGADGDIYTLCGDTRAPGFEENSPDGFTIHMVASGTGPDYFNIIQKVSLFI